MATLGTFTSHSGAGTSTGFTHTPSAAPDAVLVWVVATDAGALGGDYGGEAFGAAVYASAVPSGQVALYRVNAPPSGAQTVTVTHSTGTEFFCSCVSVIGSDAEVVDTFAGVVDDTTPFNVGISVPAGRRAAVFAGKASGSGFLDITETAPLVRVGTGSFGNRINLLSEVEGLVSGAEYTALFSDTVALVAVLLSDVGGGGPSPEVLTSEAEVSDRFDALVRRIREVVAQDSILVYDDGGAVSESSVDLTDAFSTSDGLSAYVRRTRVQDEFLSLVSERIVSGIDSSILYTEVRTETLGLTDEAGKALLVARSSQVSVADLSQAVRTALKTESDFVDLAEEPVLIRYTIKSHDDGAILVDDRVALIIGVASSFKRVVMKLGVEGYT